VDTNGEADTVSDMAEAKRQKRPRRTFTDEFKSEAVRLVLDEGKTVAEVARDLDLTHSALRTWVERARADRGRGKRGVLSTAERDELAKLRKENRDLRMEREILKKPRQVRSRARSAQRRRTAARSRFSTPTER
jgi:transposase